MTLLHHAVFIITTYLSDQRSKLSHYYRIQENIGHITTASLEDDNLNKVKELGHYRRFVFVGLTSLAFENSVHDEDSSLLVHILLNSVQYSDFFGCCFEEYSVHNLLLLFQ